jgi:hypothetical protein
MSLSKEELEYKKKFLNELLSELDDAPKSNVKAENEDFTDFLFAALGRVIILSAFIFGLVCVLRLAWAIA